ncbi:MAG: hypothetical protein UZ06_CHB003001545 [Chlorobi bacterium OLB6]|nr:MAG: hypothetical protein UZ06_CHB003001545 [Chlorobi bacterium OLB6]
MRWRRRGWGPERSEGVECAERADVVVATEHERLVVSVLDT